MRFALLRRLNPFHRASRRPEAAPGAGTRNLANLRFEALAVVALVAGLAGYAMRPQAVEATPTRVGTINLDKVYASIDRYAALQATFKVAAEELDGRVKASEARVKELEAELDSFQPGSDAQAAAIQKLQAAVAEYRAIEQFASAKREVELARAFRETYVAIKDASPRPPAASRRGTCRRAWTRPGWCACAQASHALRSAGQTHAQGTRAF